MNERLQSALHQLRLSGLALSLDVRLQEAAAHQLSHLEFLELILQDELLVRQQRQIDRRVKAADFRELKPLDDFDFAFNPSIKRVQIFDLATCRFIRETKDVLLVGPPGTGKSFLAQAIGYQAIKQGHVVWYRSIFDVVRDFLQDELLEGQDRNLNKYLKPDLLIIDDMGMKNLPRRAGEILFEIVMRRYETRSTMMTSNRPLEDWGNSSETCPAPPRFLIASCTTPRSSPSMARVTGCGIRKRPPATAIQNQPICRPAPPPAESPNPPLITQPPTPKPLANRNAFNDYSTSFTGWYQPADTWLDLTCQLTLKRNVKCCHEVRLPK